jgi:hypothetical protein
MRFSVHTRPGPFVTWGDRNLWGAADAPELRRMRLEMRRRLKRRTGSGQPGPRTQAIHATRLRIASQVEMARWHRASGLRAARWRYRLSWSSAASQASV